MRPLARHTGRTVPLRRSNVDTDQIMPAEFCKRVTKSGFEDAVFHRWRSTPGFVLEEPGRAGATVLLAGPDFGTGSSREHAVWGLRDWGFVAVLSSRFGDIFRRNALKNRLLALALPEPAMDRLMTRSERDPSFEVTVDVAAGTVGADGDVWEFDLDERTRWLLLNGYDDIAVTLREAESIEAYETQRPYWLPSIRPDHPSVPRARTAQETT
ncbi:3-isopropylmalate dehydratase small subunit [Streptomyces sp. MMG1121]|uniref:3-isopropylmalate dehydratase small subunit n=1 Tax=Streptomyces sp. MMG1121 TaxID=1415544 RepID=UPI0006ADE23D|nr:isopropylmalate isomerase [Streptomyces sp. MMG1121]